MKIIFILFLLITIISCNNQEDIEKETTIISAGTIPETRTAVSSRPIAGLTENAGDALNKDWAFTVKVYQTAKTFQFVMKIKYQELEAVDTLKIPNIGIEPVVVLKSGKEKFSCIVGFKDKAQQFKEYKKVSVENNQLKIKVLKHYAVYTSIKK
ncbi:hypothetical protein GALL_94390 [mine drainage metagenome]|uniref:Lipoprotein n=1 Tax=mine drainage metagenome TaxID=410659 RepID=A0A1J5SIN0_9ZZZZ